ncbi:hypothetical protein K2173_008775 [Erythroxylum novogranatense]|uniref:Uncharacterized protein n=1 Tax=Erythroxylum novogranatense TaxID=1862640 RepID=A0AAV8SYN3_9ROSI|nr:hypothetical protein K2173_008775 [Erythroxylum novogranatense]
MLMEEEVDHTSLAFPAPQPWLVSFFPLPLSSGRLSTHFTPSRRIPSVHSRLFAWVSLQGRLVNAEESSSAESIFKGSDFRSRKDEIVAWELFTPLQRFLLVAVIAVATAESNKNRVISQLRKSVNLRDEVLSSMQQKLDNLCEQVNHGRSKCEGLATLDDLGCHKIQFSQCGCWHCDQHQHQYLFSSSLLGNKVPTGDEVLQYKLPFGNEIEQEERRLSDWSDWAPSVTSTQDIQMSTFAVDQDILNLKRECEEKDATIKELATILQSSKMAGSKRIAELEDIIRRKNMMITKFRKDVLILEEKLVHLTRLQRPSSSASSTLESWKFPALLDNIVYDMDSATSPSSSDSDTSPKNQERPHAIKIPETPLQQNDLVLARDLGSAPAKLSSCEKSRSVSPLKEISTNHRSGRISSLKPRQLSAAGSDSKKIRKRTPSMAMDAAPKKKWL